ncbi:hypothetical protein [Myxococcus xanthus]|uniref:hypothetical protein n=1 Tax=Myxococcus xanthus TaxID=34 RepID=UPI0002F1D58C|nr:hypothetical protein [Myxococcus xanthus]QVW70601.1 hypothetical protein JTM82_14060 [Myxococcus xanthus DZ2]QZZ49494.1 hypothetical protein MyxoNM_09795 [Myxococcus xanthus]UEO03272.1 hypothetical protein K1515_28755 [Myxococcus xanthus DZ2]UYI16568.1 hypothetical protein N3T43_09680 [Myxococcus xanthus]UYI23930.1 hypothetical protein N1129_09685 [Myxococcus xanthus]
MDNTYLVRLKAYDARRGHVLRRYTYAGIKFQEERGWYRVEKPVADYLRTVRQLPGDAYSPLAFDVSTDAEAKAIDAAEADEAKVKRNASDELKLSAARPAGTLTTEDLPKVSEEKDTRRAKREKD